MIDTILHCRSPYPFSNIRIIVSSLKQPSPLLQISQVFCYILKIYFGDRGEQEYFLHYLAKIANRFKCRDDIVSGIVEAAFSNVIVIF